MVKMIKVHTSKDFESQLDALLLKGDKKAIKDFLLNNYIVDKIIEPSFKDRDKSIPCPSLPPFPENITVNI